MMYRLMLNFKDKTQQYETVEKHYVRREGGVGGGVDEWVGGGREGERESSRER